jgi:DNA (cytosine-5)-methyltransferase 1
VNINNLPVPGEVEFINGGPPCQVCYYLQFYI